MQKEITILAIESSCDETAAAVVRNGREVLSNVIYSQIDLHTLYGGVVPEIASRKHIEKVNQPSIGTVYNRLHYVIFGSFRAMELYTMVES